MGHIQVRASIRAVWGETGGIVPHFSGNSHRCIHVGQKQTKAPAQQKHHVQMRADRTHCLTWAHH